MLLYIQCKCLVSIVEWFENLSLQYIHILTHITCPVCACVCDTTVVTKNDTLIQIIVRIDDIIQTNLKTSHLIVSLLHCEVLFESVLSSLNTGIKNDLMEDVVKKKRVRFSDSDLNSENGIGFTRDIVIPSYVTRTRDNPHLEQVL